MNRDLIEWETIFVSLIIVSRNSAKGLKLLLSLLQLAILSLGEGLFDVSLKEIFMERGRLVAVVDQNVSCISHK